jgi:hypothetical protein
VTLPGSFVDPARLVFSNSASRRSNVIDGSFAISFFAVCGLCAQSPDSGNWIRLPDALVPKALFQVKALRHLEVRELAALLLRSGHAVTDRRRACELPAQERMDRPSALHIGFQVVREVQRNASQLRPDEPRSTSAASLRPIHQKQPRMQKVDPARLGLKRTTLQPRMRKFKIARQYQ